jgi:ABC-type metal ion transport system substrate-binding protein
LRPNAVVEDKQLDANFFQHQPYLDSYNKDRKTEVKKFIQDKYKDKGAVVPAF